MAVQLQLIGKRRRDRESHSISEIAVQLRQRVRRGRSGNGHSISEIAVQLQQRSTTNLAGGGGATAPLKMNPGSIVDTASSMSLQHRPSRTQTYPTTPTPNGDTSLVRTLQVRHF